MKKQNRNICGGLLHPPVNCSSEELMVNARLRNPELLVDRDEFHKSKTDKEFLKLYKKASKGTFKGELIFKRN
jgi:hypothetical protein